MDKFADYYNTPEKISELSEYVHLNFKLIYTKMLSEMRRKLDITPDMKNIDGYCSLMVSLYGRMFNEMIYGLAGVCQSSQTSARKILPIETILVFLDILEDKNPLKGRFRSDVPNDPEKFQKFYQESIEELRAVIEALPK